MTTCRMKTLCGLALLLLTLPARVPADEPGQAERLRPKVRGATDRLTIHEWGTFTCLQDEQGRPLAGINTDDEAVPDFVHRLSELIPRPSDLAPVYYKGVPRSHNHVRMRLETPVLYFYPPAGQTRPLHASVEVGFRGGWLTEFYPRAEVSAPGLQEGSFRYGRLSRDTRGTLAWHDLTIGGEGHLPETDAPVWLAPRAVRAATVRTQGGEAEKYLFYRGVGNIRSPLSVAHGEFADDLLIREDVDPTLGLTEPLTVRAMWLVRVDDDGGVAYRGLGGATLTGQSGTVVAQASPPPEGDSPDGFVALRAEMRAALVADGLFADEADAMLKTWELAYFKSPGLRLFYLLPQAWTDAVLPLRCSLDARISRSMVGRVEIVTPRQRTLLERLSRGPASSSDWFYRGVDGQWERDPQLLTRLWEGKIRLHEVELQIPDDYRDYLALGRFRNALILDELARRPTAGLARFAENYAIEPYAPAEDDGAAASAR